MRRNTLIASIFTLAALTVAAAPAYAQGDVEIVENQQRTYVQQKPVDARSHIDIVVALDTSSSMDGLINSARQKLWDIVNDLATAKPTPILRVGLVSFGNSGYESETGFTRIDMQLTDDLDSVYERLMGLSTNGGTEYVGRAIKVSLDSMDWKQDRKALKMIFVAGNESADQDRQFVAVDQAGRAINSDIIVNTIFCGADRDGQQSGWKTVADRADGQYASIARDGGAVVVNTPYDKDLARLSGELNKTYVAYGSAGRAAVARQERSDRSAAGLSGGASAARAKAKASKLYRNARWDLVDAQEDGKSIDEIATSELPAEMQKMNKAQRKAHVSAMAKKRKKIQARINTLNKKRDAFVKKEMKKKKAKPAAFDVAVKRSVRSKAASKGISF